MEPCAEGAFDDSGEEEDLVGGLIGGEHVRVAAAEGEDGGRGAEGYVDAEENLGLDEGCAAAIDGFDAADIVLEEGFLALHPIGDCAFGDDADAVGVDMRDGVAVGLDDQDGDIDVEHIGEIHGDGMHEVAEIIGFEQAQDGILDALLVIHVIARIFDDFARGLFHLVLIGFEAVDHVGLEICDAFFLLGGHVEEVKAFRVLRDEFGVVA